MSRYIVQQYGINAVGSYGCFAIHMEMKISVVNQNFCLDTCVVRVYSCFIKREVLHGQLLAKNKDCSGTGLEMVLIRQAAST